MKQKKRLAQRKQLNVIKFMQTKLEVYREREKLNYNHKYKITHFKLNKRQKQILNTRFNCLVYKLAMKTMSNYKK